MRSAGGAPPFCPPRARVHLERVACTDPAADGLHLARGGCRSLQARVVERAVVGAIPSTTVARILAAASLPPHRHRDGKTATSADRFTTQAAKMLWRSERVEWLDDRGEVGLGRDETPPRQVLVRQFPTQPMPRGQIARREFEDRLDGTVTCLVAFNVDEGTRWGCGLEANDHTPFLEALGRLARRSPGARRRHVLLDHGSSPLAHDTRAYGASHPRLRAFYTPPPASWRNQAALLRRACSETYLDRFAPCSRPPLIEHRNARWPEDKQRCAPPFRWSWTCRGLYAWARKKRSLICTKTYATVH
jgi:hypothetical protein